jgi:hypothetical protein
MALHEPFGHLQHTLWSKERRGVKLAVWLPTTKSRESTRSRCVEVKCDTPLKISQRELQLWFKPRPDPSLGQEVMNAQSPGSPNRNSFRTPLWESREKKSHLDVASARSCREYYKGEGGGFPWVRAVVSQVSPSCPWLVPTPKGCRMSFNQLVVGFWMQDRLTK